MTPRRLFRTLVTGGLFSWSVLASAALAAGDATQLRWGSIRYDGQGATAVTTDGAPVELGVDVHLQRELKKILTRARPLAGAAVLVDARSGQVLAAAEIGKSEGSLLFDAVAPAASVFKIITTSALYETTDVTPLTRVCTEGGLRAIFPQHLVPAKGPGAVCGKFAHALGVSRNAAYAQLATQKLMRDDLLAVAEKFGMNGPVELDVAAKTGTLSVPYNDLEFARTATGFENSRLSVFGAAQLALTIASGGMRVPMHFATPSSQPAEALRVLSQRTARRVRDAMEVTIHSGTARSSFVNERGRSTVGPVQVAGKTGTLKPKRAGPTASWFMGFAPSEHPRVVVSVVLQNPDKWVRRGHEVGRDLLRLYLESIGVAGIPAR